MEGPINPPVLAAGDHDQSRREFLKRSAVAGAVAWSAPAIMSLPGGAAWGTHYPCPCTSDAFGLRVIIPPLGIDETLAEPGPGGAKDCVADTGVLGAPGTATVRAITVCAETGHEGECTAQASIATLDVVVGPNLAPTLTVHAEVLTSEAAAGCDPCRTRGDSRVALLVVNGVTVDVDATCNNDVLGLGLVTFNEQFCEDEVLNVNALHINVLGVVEVIAAHSEAGTEGCPCEPC